MISLKTVEDINYIVTKSTGFLTDRAGLESAILSAYQTFSGEYLIADPIDRILTVYIHLTTTQYFTDGNKRTAFEVLLKLLRQENIILNIPQSKIIDISYQVANHTLNSLEDIRKEFNLYNFPEK